MQELKGQNPQEVYLPKIHSGIFNHDARFKIINAGRGFYKTGLLLVEGLKDLSTIYRTPTGLTIPNRVCYVAPTAGEARDIAWDRAKTLYQPWTVGKPNESLKEIPLMNGGKFLLRGAHKPNRLRGDYYTKLLLDEAAFFEPEAMTAEEMWQKIFRPMLSKTRPLGSATVASTPDGFNFFYELHGFGSDPTEPEWESWTYTSIEGGFITEDEVMSARSQMTEEAWRQEYMAEFIGQASRIYYAFDRRTHVKTVNFVPDLEIDWFWDFNVIPCVHSGLAHRHKGKVYIFDELCVGETPDTVRAFMEKYPKKLVKGINIYGDFTGTVSTTGHTDYQIMERMLVRAGYPRPKVYVYKGNPIVRDRTNAVNGMFRSADGHIRMYVDKSCTKLIRDFEQVKRDEKSGKINKTSDPTLSHSSDGCGYYIYIEFTPKGLEKKTRVQQKVRIVNEDLGIWEEIA